MIASLPYLAALVGGATAITSYNATLHTDAGCKSAEPYFIKGSKFTDCVTLNQTFNSISAFEDEPTGYCHFLVFTDDACKTEIKSSIDMDGTCTKADGIKSIRATCYR